MATALQDLQDLDLSRNAFKQIPKAVGRITTLRSLDMSCNEDLELTSDDMDTLAALSCLTSLCICKDTTKPEAHAGFSPVSLCVLGDITERFSKLHVPKKLH